jgi:ABC-type polysaccharide/polyol phosphate export permease
MAVRRWRALLPPFRLVLAHRRVLWRLALHDLRARYAATLVGSVWAVVNPLVVILVSGSSPPTG